jgi:uncharacterized membrane protein
MHAGPITPGRARTAPSFSLAQLEQAVSGRGLAWAGGLTLLLGALFFLSLAISRGWIGPEARVAIGLAAGLVVTGLGDRMVRGGDRVLGPVLVAVGIGIWNLALVSGTRLYDIIPIWAALLGAAAGAVTATAIAIRTNAQVIALYGLVTALAAPILFDIPSARLSMAYLVIILLGSTAVSIARGWWWLPPVAFALSDAQFFQWWGHANAPTGLVILAILSLSLIHLVAATGIDARSVLPRANAIALALLALNATAFAIVGAVELADEPIRLGLYLLAGVAAHAVAGLAIQRVTRQTTVFASSAFAVAVILFTGAIPAFFDGPPVAIGWAAEAVGLVWLATRYQSNGAFAAAALVFGLATMHLFTEEFRPVPFGTAPRYPGRIPFADEAGLTLLAMLALLAVAGRITREPLGRIVITVIGFGLVIAALPQELWGIPLLAGWSLLAVLALASERPLGVAALRTDTARVAMGRAANLVALVAIHGLKLVAAVAAGLAIQRAVIYEMPVLNPVPFVDRLPYAGQPIAATAILVLAAAAAMRVTISDAVRQIAGVAAVLVTAHLAAFLFDPALTAALWALLAVVAAFLQRPRDAFRLYLVVAALLLVFGVCLTLGQVAPPSRLLVRAGVTLDHPFLWNEATLALGALAAACFVIAWRLRGDSASSWLALGGSALAVYLLSISIVDLFQARVDDAASVAELRWQSQVALSVVWALLGGVTIAIGLARAFAPLRWFGLGLLALATVKVFLYDLASLDAIYRVMSFVVLGVLLLLSAYAYRRFDTGDDPPDALAERTGEGPR